MKKIILSILFSMLSTIAFAMERQSSAGEGWSDGEIEEDKSHGVEKHWPASPHEGKTTRIEAGRSLRC